MHGKQQATLQSVLHGLKGGGGGISPHIIMLLLRASCSARLVLPLRRRRRCCSALHAQEATTLAQRCIVRSKDRGMSRYGGCRVAASVLTKVREQQHP